MSDNKKYYYFKFKENFFDGNDKIKLLAAKPNGSNYIVLLLKLYCVSLKNNGKLQFDEGNPYDINQIADLVGEQLNKLFAALSAFVELGLAEITQDGLLYMSDIELMVGQSSTDGERKKKARENLKKSDKCPPETEIEPDLESIVTETERQTETDPKNKYGLNDNVYLSAAEYQNLKNMYPDICDDAINAYSAELLTKTSDQILSHDVAIRARILHHHPFRNGSQP